MGKQKSPAGARLQAALLELVRMCEADNIGNLSLRLDDVVLSGRNVGSWSLKLRKVLSSEEKRASQKRSARNYIQGDKGKLRRKLRRNGLSGQQLDAALASELSTGKST